MTESRMRKIVNRSYVRPMGDLDSSKAWSGYRGSEGRGVAVVKRGVVSEAIATLDDARCYGVLGRYQNGSIDDDKKISEF